MKNKILRKFAMYGSRMKLRVAIWLREWIILRPAGRSVCTLGDTGTWAHINVKLIHFNQAGSCRSRNHTYSKYP